MRRPNWRRERMMGERVIVLPLAPPRRLAPGARFRSFKTQTDRQVWERAWSQVAVLQQDGWRVQSVSVDVGRVLPLMPSAVIDWVRALCDLPDDVRVDWEWSGTSRGSTTVHLVRE